MKMAVANQLHRGKVTEKLLMSQVVKFHTIYEIQSPIAGATRSRQWSLF